MENDDDDDDDDGDHYYYHHLFSHTGPHLDYKFFFREKKEFLTLSNVENEKKKTTRRIWPDKHWNENHYKKKIKQEN